MPLDDTTGFLKAMETKPDVFSLEGLIAWLEKQSPETRYNYDCVDGSCLLGLYLAAHGFGMDYYCEISCVGTAVANIGGGVAWGGPVAPKTLGAALDRARKLLAERG
jgi:hypothetical protein